MCDSAHFEYCQHNLSSVLFGLVHLAMKATCHSKIYEIKHASRHIETLVCVVRCSNLLDNLSPLKKLFKSFKIIIVFLKLSVVVH